MHILITIVGLLAAAAFWYYRLRTLGKAGREVADQLGRVRGNVRRAKIRKQVEGSPITAIDDPIIAAASLLCLLALNNDPLTSHEEEAIRRQLERIVPQDDTGEPDAETMEEAVTYGRWVHRQGLDAPKAIRMLAAKLNEWLQSHQVRDLVEMIDGLEADNDIATSRQRTEQARRRLRLGSA